MNLTPSTDRRPSRSAEAAARGALSRRSVLAGGAIAVPVFVVSTAVPAYATSTTPPTLSVTAPNNAVTAVGSTPVTATLTSSPGAGVAGGAVSFTGPLGSTFAAATGTTDGSGQYTTPLTLGTPWIAAGSPVPVTAVSDSTVGVGSFTALAANMVAAGNNSSGSLLGRTSPPTPTQLQHSTTVFPSPIVSVASSGYQAGYTLVLLADGTVWAAGSNALGQLGDGSFTDRAAWAEVAGLPSVTTIWAFGATSYATDASGGFWSWGAALTGGTGSPTPALVTGITDVQNLFSAVTSSVIAQKSDGTWWVWGSNGSGQLATGTTLDVPLPTRNTALDAFTTLASGFGSGFLGLKNDGSVWGWGDNSNGQLCDDTTTTRSQPVRVTGITGVAEITAGIGGALTDATGYARKTDGTVWGWGKNAHEQIDNSGTTDITHPTQIVGVANPRHISASYASLYALQSDGSIWYRGATLDSQVTTTGTVLASPRPITTISTSTTATASEQAVLAITADTTVSVSITRNPLTAGVAGTVTARVATATATVAAAPVTLAVTGTGAATLAATTGATDGTGAFTTTVTPDTWITPGGSVQVSATDGGGVGTGTASALGANLVVAGVNALGSLLGAAVSPSNASLPTLQQTAAVFPSPIIDVASAGYFTPYTMVLLADGSVWTVGGNRSGQLGDGTKTNRNTWAQVAGLPEITKIWALAGTSYALDRNGDLWSWGEARFSLLGYPSANDQPLPSRVPGLSGVQRLYRPIGPTLLAQKTDGTWWVWGWNAYGQLATGDTTTLTTPTRNPALDDFTALAGSFGYGVLGLKSDGTVWGWGQQVHGQLCDGTTNTRILPVQIPGLSDVVEVAAAASQYYNYTSGYARQRNGTVWGWGRNDNKQVDDSGSTNLTTPVQVLGVTNPVHIAASNASIYALQSDGSVWYRGVTANNSGNTSGTTLTSPRPITSITTRLNCGAPPTQQAVFAVVRPT